jgi:hypothetical protein
MTEFRNSLDIPPDMNPARQLSPESCFFQAVFSTCLA